MKALLVSWMIILVRTENVHFKFVIFSQAPAYDVLSQAIKTCCRVAIWLSERV